MLHTRQRKHKQCFSIINCRRWMRKAHSCFRMSRRISKVISDILLPSTPEIGYDYTGMIRHCEMPRITRIPEELHLLCHDLAVQFAASCPCLTPSEVAPPQNAEYRYAHRFKSGLRHSANSLLVMRKTDVYGDRQSEVRPPRRPAPRR